MPTLKKMIADVFGSRGQYGLAEFYRVMGDEREASTIVRSINNWVCGRNAPPHELVMMLRLLHKPAEIPKLLRQVRDDPPVALFKLLPPPEHSVAPRKRRE